MRGNSNWMRLAGVVLGVLLIGQALSAEPAPITPGEHPRLIFRGNRSRDTLRQTAATEWGKGVTYRLHQTLKLMARASIIGRNQEVVKEAGFRAAGHAAVHQIGGTRGEAENALRVLLKEVVDFPMNSRVSTSDRASRLHGAALTYDLCYDAWDAATQSKVAAFLRQESDALLNAVGGTSNFKPDNDVHVTVCAVAGLSRLAVLADPPDNTEADTRVLNNCERAVRRYLNEAIGEHGFCAYGESVRQAAMASGILPFARALRLVTGGDLIQHPAITQALRPMVYGTVPGVGLPIIGEATAAVDRSGMFALATDLAPTADRTAIAWLFKRLDGDKYKGVVRPHHALYMLQSGMESIEASAPSGEGWPKVIQSPKAHVVGLRSAWNDESDLVMLCFGGRLRVIGLGSRWISAAGQHANKWSDSPSVGRIDNIFTFPTGWGKQSKLYEVRQQIRLLESSSATDGSTIQARFGLKGQVKRLQDSIEPDKRRKKGEEAEQISVPDGGPFEGERLLGVDYSGASGAPLLIVFDDKITGGGRAFREWVLHLGFDAKFETNGPTFTVQRDDLTLRGVFLNPGESSELAGTPNPPYANFLHLRTQQERVQVVLTIGLGQPPEVNNAGNGFFDGVRIGSRLVKRVGNQFEFLAAQFNSKQERTEKTEIAREEIGPLKRRLTH